MTAAKIAVIDDEPHICEVIRLYLAHSNFEPLLFHHAQEALEAMRAEPPDLILLDVMLPDMSGFELCRTIRGEVPRLSELPIIMLTAKGESMDKLRGFSLGVDDYMVKPFDPNELIARIRAVLRRAAPAADGGRPTGAEPPARVLQFGGLVIDLDSYKVAFEGQRIEMTPKEIELLYFLAGRPNRVFSREELLGHVWDFDFSGGTRTVDAHVKNLRKKLPAQSGWRIHTLWGVGYSFEVPDDAS